MLSISNGNRNISSSTTTSLDTTDCCGLEAHCWILSVSPRATIPSSSTAKVVRRLSSRRRAQFAAFAVL